MKNSLTSSGQIALPISEQLLQEADRNFQKGGRSFYFFDFDDNVVHLPTKMVLFHKTDGREVIVSTADYAAIQHQISQPNTEWAEFEHRYDPLTGSFRNFRERPRDLLEGKDQPLVSDTMEALQHPFLEWRGPSWDFFVYAVNNNRPISIITARGHHPHTVRQAINILVMSRDLKLSPNYLSIYPVSSPETRALLGDSEYKQSVAEMKKRAIHRAVRDAFECYGENPYHRFGMSDDDPANVALIIEAMRELKQAYPENAFYVINTHNRQLIKEEVTLDGVDKKHLDAENQLSLL